MHGEETFQWLSSFLLVFFHCLSRSVVVLSIQVAYLQDGCAFGSVGKLFETDTTQFQCRLGRSQVL